MVVSGDLERSATLLRMVTLERRAAKTGQRAKGRAAGFHGVEVVEGISLVQVVLKLRDIRYHQYEMSKLLEGSQNAGSQTVDSWLKLHLQ